MNYKGSKTGHTVVLYTTAVCNLNCRYCFIDKNPALKSIDDILDESFKGDYYFNYCKEVFPDPNQLTRIETWGGEPFLRMDRAYYTIERMLEYYPNLKTFSSSTNFTNNNWFEQFEGLLNVFSKFPSRQIDIELQLSLDGPEEITDSGRGKGVTKKLTENFYKLLDKIPVILPNNVILNIHFKQTLDSDSIYLLQNENSIISYYKFFEKYYEAANKVSEKINNFHYSVTIPNTACPSPHTKEDGIAFANFCKICRDIENKNKVEPIFQFYGNITPYSTSHCDCPQKTYSLNKNCGACGTGLFVIGLLPNRMISGCHMAFVDLISDYKKYANEHLNGETTIDFHMFTSDREPQMTFPFDYLPKYEQKIQTFYNQNATAKIVNLASELHLLALNNQASEKYKDLKEAVAAANLFASHTSYCIRDCYATTGSLTISPIGLLKLIFNGAEEYIFNE